MADVRDLVEFGEFWGFCNGLLWHSVSCFPRDRGNLFETWNEEAFRRRCRSRKSSVRAAVDLLRERVDEGALVNGVIPSEVQVLIAVRVYTKRSYQDDVVNIHGLNRSTHSRIGRRVSPVLCERRLQSVHFPTGQREQTDACQ